MKKIVLVLFGIAALFILISVGIRGYRYFHKRYMYTITLKEAHPGDGIKIIFFHHSTGRFIWRGGVPQWFKEYNRENNKNYQIIEQIFPKPDPYGYGRLNFPYDYWNIWVNNGGPEPYKNEPTLEMVAKKYDIIIWKHCFPVTYISEDMGEPNINSDEKRIENYKLHYEALKSKMNQFNSKKFIVWTGAAQVRGAIGDESARLARSFFHWVRDEWDQPNDNIFLWDFYELETEGGLYFKDEYAMSEKDSHPNKSFSERVAPLFCQRIVDVIEGRGDRSNITGK